MARGGDVALVCGIAGVLLGGGAFFYAFRQEQGLRTHQTVLDEDGERITQLVEEKTALQADVQEANKRISALRLELEEARTQIAALQKRVDGLEHK
jgi:chromosome segregation ATPase